VTTAISVAGNVTLDTASTIDVDANITGDLVTLTATTVEVAGGTTITAQNGNLNLSGSSTTLDDSGAVILQTTVVDGSNVLLGAVTASGMNNDLTINSTEGVTLSGAVNLGATEDLNVTFDTLGTDTVTFTAGETITANNIDVSGTGVDDDIVAVTINGSGNVTLDTASTIDVNANITGDAVMLAGTTIEIQAGVTLNTVNGNLDLNTSVTSIVTEGSGTVTFDQNGEGFSIQLADLSDDGGTDTVAVVVNADGSVSAGTFDLGATTNGDLLVVSDANGSGGAETIVLGTASNVNDVAITNNAGVVLLPAITAGGTLDVTAAGTITQSGALVVTGASVIDSAGNDITLDDAANVFTGSMTFNNLGAGDNLTVVDTTALQLQAGLSVNNLNVDAEGITQAGPLVVAGITTIDANASDALLANVSNDFQGTVVITGGDNITLADTNAISIGASTVTTTLDVTSGAGIAVTGTIAAGNVDFDASSGAGDIFDTTGNLVVSGSANFAAQSTDDVLLDAASNNFNTFAVTRADNVTVSDVDDLVLNATAISGNLNVTAAGTITGTQLLSINGGSTTLDAGGIVVGTNNISLTNAGNDFQSVAITNGGNVTLVDANGLSLAASNLPAGTLDITADALTVTGAVSATNLDIDASGGAGDVTDTTGSLKISAGTSIVAQASDDVILDAGTNDFTSVSAIADNVTVVDANNIILNASSVSGILNITASGTISGSQALSVTGATVLDAGGTATTTNDVTLTNAANDFAFLSITNAGNASIVDNNVISLGSANLPAGLYDVSADAITVSGTVTAGNVDFDATGGVGNITDTTGNLLVTSGTTTLQAQTTDDVILDGSSNDFLNVTVTQAEDITLVDANNIVLGAVSSNGALLVTANGSIAGVAAVTVTGQTVLNATGTTVGANNVSLTDMGNDFGGAVSVLNAGDVTLVDADDLILGNANLPSGTLDADATGIDLAGTITATNVDLDVTSGVGNITDSTGHLVVSGTTTLSATTTDFITLDDTDNDLNLTLINAGTGTVTLVDTDDVNLGLSATTGTLDVLADSITLTNNITVNALSLDASSGVGNINQSAGVLTVATTASFEALSIDDISVNQSNLFGGALSVVEGDDVSFTDAEDITLGTVNVSNDFAVTASGSVSGAQLISVAGVTTLNATGQVRGANDISLSNTLNDFDSIVIANGGDVLIEDTNSIDLGLANVGGIYSVTADNAIDVIGTVVAVNVNFDASFASGDITDTGGNLVVSGSSTFNTLTSDDVVLDSLTNDFESVLITAADNVTLVDLDNISLGTSAVNSLLSVTADSIDIVGSISADDVNLDASTGAGDITDTGAGDLSVTGTTTITVLAGDDVILDAAGNDFNAIGVNGADNAFINDANDVVLNASTITTNFDVTANGSISSTQTITVGGTATLNAASRVVGNNDISLNDASNDFATLIVTNGGDVTIEDTNSINLGAAGVGGLFDVTVDNGIDIIGSVSAGSINFDATTGVGAIVNSTGDLSVAGIATFAAQTTDNVTLDAAGNDFTSIGVTSGDDVTIVDSNSVVLNLSTVTGNLLVTADGGITGTQAIAVTGATILDATGQVVGVNDISLTNTANDFGLVVISNAGDVNLDDADDISFGASVVGGTLDVDAGAIDLAGTVTAADINFDATAAAGDITDGSGGNLVVTGTSTFTVSGADQINLTNVANDLNIVLINAGTGAVTLVDSDDIELDDSTLAGALNVTADGIDITGSVVAANATLDASTGAGDITDTGAGDLSVTGTTTITVLAGDDVILDAAGNDFNAIGVNGADNALINDANDVVLNASTITTNFDVTANGSISSTQTITVGGTAALNTTGTAIGTNDIDLTNALNDFTGITLTNAGDVTLVDVDEVAINASSVSGLLAVSADDISILAGQSVTAGSLAFTAGTTATGTITIAQTLTTTTGEMVFSNAAVLDVDADLNSAGGITVNTTNQVQLDLSTLTAEGDIDLAGANAITIAGNGTVTLDANADGAILLADVTDVGDSLSTGLDLNAEGGITLATVNLDDGTTDGLLSILFDSDDDGDLTFTANNNISNVSSLSIAGSGTSDDTIVVNSDVTTSIGGILFSQVQEVDLNAGLDAATTISISNVDTVQLDAGNTYVARGGALDINDSVNQIELFGTGTITLSTTNNNSIELTDIIDTEIASQTELSINSASNITLASVDLNGATDGDLTLLVDSEGNGIRSINVGGALTNVDALTVTGVGGNDNLLLNGSVSASGAVSIMTMNNVTLADSVDITGSSVALGTTTLTISAGGGSSIESTSNEVQLDNVTASADLSLTGETNLIVGDITSAEVVELDSDSAGVVTVNSFAGGGAIDIGNDGTTTFAGNVNASTVDINSLSGGVEFQSDTIITQILTSPFNYSISFIGDNTTIANATLVNSGGLIFGDSASDIITFTSGVTATASDITLSGTLQSTDDILTLGNINLAGDSTIDVTDAAGLGAAINFTGTIDSTNATARVLTLDSGTTGIVTVTGAVDRISTLNVVNSAGVTFNGAVGTALNPLALDIADTETGAEIVLRGNTNLASINTGAAAFSVSLLGSSNIVGATTLAHTAGLTLGNEAADQSTFTADVSYLTGSTNLAGDLVSSENSLNFGATTLDANADIDTTNGGGSPAGANVTFASVVGGNNQLLVNAGTAGAIQTSGLVRDLSTATLTAGTGGISVGGSLDTVVGAINLSTSGTITLAGAVNDVTTLNILNSGNVNFQGTVGASVPGTIDIQGAALGAVITFAGNTSLVDLVTTAATDYDIAFFGRNNTIANNVDFLNAGELFFGDEQLDTILFGNGLSNSGLAATTIEGTLGSNGNALLFDTLTVGEGGVATLDTLGGAVTINTLVGTPLNGAEELIIDAGQVGSNGVVVINNVNGASLGLEDLTIADAASITLGPVALTGDLLVTGTTSTTTFNNTVTVGNADVSSALTIITNTFQASGSISQTGPLNLGADLSTSGLGIEVNGNVTISEAQTVNISTGGGTLDVNGTVQGVLGGAIETLTVDTGAGDVSIDDLRGAPGSNGAGTGLNAVVITNAGSVDVDEVALSGILNVSATGNVDLASTDNATPIRFLGNIGGSLDVTASNRVLTTGTLTVGGNSTFVSTFPAPVGTSAVDLTNLDASGTLSVTADSATITNAQSLTLGIVNIGNPLDADLTPYDANFTATIGTITGVGQIQVADQLILNAASGTGGVLLSNASNAFGSLDINSPTGTVTIRESDQTDIVSVLASDLVLRSDGDINAPNIANSIGSLSITDGDNVTLNNNAALELREISVAQLELTTTGAVSDTSTNTVTVSGLTTIDPGANNITFGNVDLGTIRLTNANDIAITEINDIEIDNIVANSLAITATGDISQTAGSIVNITNVFDLQGGGDVILDGNNTFGAIQIDGSNVEIEGSGGIALQAINATTLTVTTSGGDITQSIGTATTVAGLGSFETIGGNITLTDPASSFGSISLSGNNVEFTAVSAIEIEGIDADNLTFIAGGDITGAGQVVVSDSASFDAGLADFDLTNVNNSIANLSVTAASVDLSLSGDVELDQLDVSGVFDLTAGGAITDGNSASINVGQAILDATGDIILGDSGSVDFAVLNLSGAAVDITVSGAAEIESVSADSLSLAASGDITQSDGSDINVTSATFSNAGNNITLTGNDNSLGSIEITSAGDVEITNSSAIQLNTINANNFSLTNSGAISDGGRIEIAGDLIIDAGPSDIILNQNQHSFETLTVQGGEVRIIDSTGDTELLTVNVDTLELVTSGDVTSTSEIRVDEDLEISADDGVGQILLTNIGNRLNRLKLTGSTVDIHNTLETELVDIDVSTFRLFSGGDVTDSADDEVEVRGLATITAGEGFDVLLGTNANDNVQIESVLISGDRVILNQTSDVVIEGITAAGDLRVSSIEGSISSVGNAVISSAGAAVFNVGRDAADIDLGQSTNSFGSLSLVGRDIDIAESDSSSLVLVDADNLTLSSGGDVTNTDRANINTLLLADISATGDVVLGDGIADAVNFGRLSLTAANANILESSDTQLAGLSVSGNLTLQSENSMTDEENATLTVGGLATLTVTGQPQQILFDGPANSFGALNLTSENITMNLADGTTLTNVVADNFILNAPVGVVSIANSADFLVDQSADIRARRITFNEDSNVEVGSLALSTRTGGAIEIRTSINPRLIAGNPSNAAGSISIIAPEVFLGIDGGQINLTTVGSVDGGGISISGVDASGLPSSEAGIVNVAGSVSFDTTNSGSAVGASINIVSGSSGAGTIRLQDTVDSAAFNLTAGSGSIDLGNFDADARLSSLVINSGLNVDLDNLHVAGNTVDINATGNVNVSGVIDDSSGTVRIETVGSLNIAGTTSAAGSVSLVSGASSVSAQAINAGGNVSVVSERTLLLGSNTSGGGSVTLLSNDSITSSGTITAGSDTTIIAGAAITIGAEGIDSVVSGGNTTITADAGNVSITDVTSAGDSVVFSLQGRVSQAKDTVLQSGSRTTVSAETGIDIASIQSVGDVTLLINQQTVALGEDSPSFTRVNDPIPLGQGEVSQDVNSTNGNIVLLAPLADVGSADAGQNFVLRSGVGVFYGLDQGSFFSDDIGSTNILNSLPSSTNINIAEALASAPAFSLSDDLSLNIGTPVFIDGVTFGDNLLTSFNASASAGETTAASSSRSTAASQRDDEEEVDEVDEVAFQNLKNYDENPQGILLPADQTFAYDDEGNIYLVVSLAQQSSNLIPGPLMGPLPVQQRNSVSSVQRQQHTVFKVELDITRQQDNDLEALRQADFELSYGYRPEFMALGSASGED
jgi:hypothetical protein